MPSRRGKLIAFEGIDGSGKSTAIAAVARALEADGHALHVTREETDAPTGGWVRQSIRDGLDPLATTFLFLADRANHVPALRRELESGRHVLIDRYAWSTLAYQGVTLRGRVADPRRLLRSLHEPLALDPDHVLLLTLDPERAVERAGRRGATAPYEKAAFLSEVQREYLEVAQGDPRATVLDADRPADLVAQDAVRIVRAWLGPAKAKA